MFSDYTKHQILLLRRQGNYPTKISKLLQDEGIAASRRGISKFLLKYEESGTITRKKGSGCTAKINEVIKGKIEEYMTKDDETTAKQLGDLLAKEGHAISKSTILRARRSLGWTFRGSFYRQLIREANKAKRLQWEMEYRGEAVGDGFQDVLWTDECTVQLENHRRFCCRKKGEPPKNKPR